MTESGWGDYISHVGSADAAAEVSRAADPTEDEDAWSTDDAELAAGGTSLESGAENPDWSDWHGGGDGDTDASGQSHLNSAAGTGGYDDPASPRPDGADAGSDEDTGQSETAANFSSTTSMEVAKAADYESSGEAGDAGSYDTSTSYDTSSYDTSSYDTGTTE